MCDHDKGIYMYTVSQSLKSKSRTGTLYAAGEEFKHQDLLIW